MKSALFASHLLFNGFAFACVVGCDAPADEACETFEATAPIIDGAVIIGSGDADGFMSTAPNAVVELELGTQGGWMVRPVLRLDASALGASEGSCVWTEVTADIAGLEPVTSVSRLFLDYANNTDDDGANDIATSDPLAVFLTFDLDEVDGELCGLKVRVEGPDAASSAEIDVVLMNTE